MTRKKTENTRRKAQAPYLSIVVLILSILAIYAQTIGFGFLRFDDPDYTFACSFVKDGLSWSNVCEAFRNVRHGAVWMPLTWISYMADISLFGRGAAGHHLVNVALHLANALLLLRLVFSIIGINHVERVDHVEISGKRRLFNFSTFQLFNILSVLAVLFWALHPQRVEAVAWIASRRNSCGRSSPSSAYWPGEAANLWSPWLVVRWRA